MTLACSCVPREDITGVVEAYAVDGTPADSVMLAMHSNIFKVCAHGMFMH